MHFMERGEYKLAKQHSSCHMNRSKNIDQAHLDQKAISAPLSQRALELLYQRPKTFPSKSKKGHAASNERRRSGYKGKSSKRNRKSRQGVATGATSAGLKKKSGP